MSNPPIAAPDALEALTPAPPAVLPRRCVHIRSNGKRCQYPAFIEGYLCTFHGGDRSRASDATRRRLMHLQNLAVEKLYELLSSPLTPEDVMLRASCAVLDRTGVGPGTTLAVTAMDARSSRDAQKVIEAMSDQELFAHMDRLKLQTLAERTDPAWRSEKLEETNVTIAAAEAAGIPDRAFYDQLIQLRDDLSVAGQKVGEAGGLTR